MNDLPEPVPATGYSKRPFTTLHFLEILLIANGRNIMARVNINESPREKNNRIADENRKQLKSFRVLNMIGSPGAGKTAILEKTAEVLGEKLAVIEGDIQTDIDASRITKHGSRAFQIQTGGSCHLNAEQVRNALDQLDLTGVQTIIIENVGNLVCPSGFELGEDAKVAVVSLPEGDEKPIKYPDLFMRAQAVIINKIDLAVEEEQRLVERRNPAGVQIGRALEPLDPAERRIEGGVQPPGLDRCRAWLVLGDELEARVLDRRAERLRTAVAVVLGELHLAQVARDRRDPVGT